MSEADRFQNLRALEAVLFAVSEPVTAEVLQESLPTVSDISELLNELSDLYANRGVALQRVGKAYAFRTAPDLAHLFTRNKTVERKLSRAAIESLAVIAYHQPLTWAEIEEVRGVALSKGTLGVLLEAGWIMPRGCPRSSPGKPMLWGTTQAFLDHFDLESLTSLPGLDELKAAGFLDTRPAVTALDERASLFDVQDPADEGESEPLAQDFGETLVPEDGEDRTSLKEPLDRSTQ
ncbi:MAG: SMC-Scp complex subunit ScpB [Rhodospirillales bacterium]|nr:SMC-Scp complex subunit ScpB [Rhodospirillales bacterium]